MGMADVQKPNMGDNRSSRSGSDWKKEYVLTWGDLISRLTDEKSAEVIVPNRNEPFIRWRSHKLGKD